MPGSPAGGRPGWGSIRRPPAGCILPFHGRRQAARRSVRRRDTMRSTRSCGLNSIALASVILVPLFACADSGLIATGLCNQAKLKLFPGMSRADAEEMLKQLAFPSVVYVSREHNPGDIPVGGLISGYSGTLSDRSRCVVKVNLDEQHRVSTVESSTMIV